MTLKSDQSAILDYWRYARYVASRVTQFFYLESQWSIWAQNSFLVAISNFERSKKHFKLNKLLVLTSNFKKLIPVWRHQDHNQCGNVVINSKSYAWHEKSATRRIFLLPTSFNKLIQSLDCASKWRVRDKLQLNHNNVRK